MPPHFLCIAVFETAMYAEYPPERHVAHEPAAAALSSLGRSTGASITGPMSTRFNNVFTTGPKRTAQMSSFNASPLSMTPQSIL